jgi:hypothetical protein
VHYKFAFENKAMKFFFFFEDLARNFLDAGEFVRFHSALCIFVCGSYCGQHVTSPAMMEYLKLSYLLAVSQKSAQIAERSLFCCGIQFCLAKFLTQNFVAGRLVNV